MGEKNSKIILTTLIIILVIIAVVFVIMIMNKDKQPMAQETTPVEIAQEAEEGSSEEGSSEEGSSEDGVTPLTEEKKEELAAIKNTIGTIRSVDIGAIVVSTIDGDLTLKVPQEGASFVTQTLQEDGSFLMEEIGLFDLPTEKEADIQYNGTTNEVMLVVIK